MEMPGDFDFDTAMWMAINSNPHDMIVGLGVATGLQGLMLLLVLATTWRYYMLFTHVDPLSARIGVGICSVLACGAFGMHCVQLSEFVYHSGDNFAAVARFDILCSTGTRLLGGIYALLATTYFGVRIWRLSGRKLYVIPPLIILVLAAFALMIATVAYSTTIPVITAENLLGLGEFTVHQALLIKLHSGVALATDLTISAALVYYLLVTKKTVYGDEGDKGLISRIIVFVFAAMLPPTINVLITLVVTNMRDSGTIINFVRILFVLLPLSYYQSLLFSLVARHRIRQIVVERGPVAQFHGRANIDAETGQTSTPLPFLQSVVLPEEGGSARKGSTFSGRSSTPRRSQSDVGGEKCLGPKSGLEQSDLQEFLQMDAAEDIKQGRTWLSRLGRPTTPSLLPESGIISLDFSTESMVEEGIISPSEYSPRPFGVIYPAADQSPRQSYTRDLDFPITQFPLSR